MKAANESQPDSPSPTNQRNAANAAKVSTENHGYPGRTLENNDTIRLVELFPGSDDEPVCCALFNVRLQDSTRPEYEALSYYWGDPTARHEIEVYNSLEAPGGEKTSFLVPINCFSALRRLRRRSQHGTADRNPIFWIDSICIDQNCIPERNHQLSLMGSIYSKASRVVIDLGSEADDSSAFMDWIADLHAPSEHAAQIVNPSRETIQSFFARPWFRRVWVLQEALLACDVTALCGNREVPWEAFKTFKNYDIGKTVRQLPYVLRGRASTWFGGTETDENKISRRLFNCLRDSRGCEATDPRDQVYALLPLLMGDLLAQGRHKPFITPDYSRTTTEVYTDLACKFLSTPGIGLGVLQTVFPSSNIPGLPSWVPDWSTKPRFSYMLYDHHDTLSPADTAPLAKFLDEWSNDFSTMSDTDQQVWHVDPVMHGLFVSIASLGSITHLTSPAIISSDELPLTQWKTVLPQWCSVRSDDISQPHRFIVKPNLEGFALTKVLGRCELSPFTRTLVKDRVPYPYAIKKAEDMVIRFEKEHPRRSRMEATPPGTNVDGEAFVHPSQRQTYWRELRSRGFDASRHKDSIIGLFGSLSGSDHASAFRILDSCDGRRMAVIGGELLALVPMETRETDWIGLIRGIKAPMVMRYAEDSSEYDGYRKTRLVGECFVLDVAGEGTVRTSATNGWEKIVII